MLTESRKLHNEEPIICTCHQILLKVVKSKKDETVRACSIHWRYTKFSQSLGRIRSR